MKTMFKMLSAFIIAISIVAIMPDNTCLAATSSGSSAISAIDSIQTDSAGATTASSGLMTVVGKLLGFLQIASGIVAVLMIAIVGFNYIIATPQVKDEMKNKMLPIIIGIVLVFGATSVAKFLIGVAG